MHVMGHHRVHGMTNHDAGYHLLFSHPQMVEDLFRSFVDEPWVTDIDFGTLERVNARLHAEGLDRRDGDIIYRARLLDGSDVYLYLLLEFQSRPDPWMAVRVMVYVGLLYQHLIREGRVTPRGKLPPVFPLALYNGQAPWRASTELRRLIDLPSGIRGIAHFQPRMRYHLIQERDYPEGRNGSLVGLLFRLENCEHLHDLQESVDALIDLLGEPEFQNLRRDFSAWMRHVLIPSKAESPATEQVQGLSEVKTMLAEKFKQWEREIELRAIQRGMEKGLAEGMQQGMQQGVQQGIGQGEAALLSRQLARRFGPLPGWVEEKLHAADQETLERWGIQLLDADSLERVFQ